MTTNQQSTLKKQIEEEDDEILKMADEKTVKSYQKEIEECDKSIAKINEETKKTKSSVLRRQDTASL